MVKASVVLSVFALSVMTGVAHAATVPASVATFPDQDAWISRQGFEEYNASGQMSQIGARHVQWSPKLSRLMKIRQEERKLQEADGGTLTQDDADHIRSELNDLEMHDW
ncbi:MAG: hypothetical protein ABSD74_07990 [Rhizomicrobium sp.]|jgi:hypothetical protein